MLEYRLEDSERDFPEALERYLGAILHVPVHVHPFGPVRGLPTFLGRIYRFYEAKISGQRCVFVAAREQPSTPVDIAKHIALVRSAIDAIAVFAARYLTAHNRSRLIAQGVAFVVPGNQLYVPDLAMDLRERFRARRTHPTDGLPPAAQAVLFHHLLHFDQRDTTPSAIAGRLGYSAMSVGRAFDELEAAGLARTTKHGRERHLEFKESGRALMEISRPLLRSPVRAVKYIRGSREPHNLKLAGESGLAELTDLSAPRVRSYAIAATDWKKFAKNFSCLEVEDDEPDFAIETWSYDPAGLSDGPVVDRLSLYAQFWSHRDERVAMVAQRLLEDMSW